MFTFLLRTAFVCAGREFRGDLVDGWTVDREGCHGDHVGSQLNKCWQELEQPLRPQALASISSCSLGIRQRICLSLSLSLCARGFQSSHVSYGMRNSNWIHHVNSATLTYKSYNGLHY